MKPHSKFGSHALVGVFANTPDPPEECLALQAEEPFDTLVPHDCPAERKAIFDLAEFQDRMLTAETGFGFVRFGLRDVHKLPFQLRREPVVSLAHRQYGVSEPLEIVAINHGVRALSLCDGVGQVSEPFLRDNVWQLRVDNSEREAHPN